MNVRSITLAILGSLLLGSCSWFGGDDKPEEVKPNALTSFRQEVDVDVLWSQKIGKGADDRAIRIRPAISGSRIFAATADGSVSALQLDTGRVSWKVRVKAFYSKVELSNGFTKDLDTITGGVGVGDDLVVVGTASGEVIALNQSDGSLAWRVATSSEVLSAPLISDDLVIVQTIDGKVAGYDAIDGTRKWLYSTTTPSLSLRGTTTPIVAGNIVVTGFANGRVAFLDLQTGLLEFDQRIAVAQGTSDLDRLVDIDGLMQLVDNKLFVASFQGRVAGIDITSGRVIWAEDASSTQGLGAGFGNVYLSKSDGQITAYNADSGREVWNVDALLHREITVPVTVGSYLALTDFDGYLHLLAQSDGRFVARRKLGTVKAGLLTHGGFIYAMGDNGSLSAMEVR